MTEDWGYVFWQVRTHNGEVTLRAPNILETEFVFPRAFLLFAQISLLICFLKRMGFTWSNEGSNYNDMIAF